MENNPGAKKLVIGAQKSGGLTLEERRMLDKEKREKKPEKKEAISNKKTKEEIVLEESVVTAENLEPLEEGSNINFVAELEDGSRAVLKLYDPETVNVTFAEPEKMERVNYVISEIMGFHIVPATIVKEVPTKGLSHPKLDDEDRSFNQLFGKVATGSLQRFVEDAEKLDDIGEESVPKSKLLPLYIWDFITANWDRHASNVLIDQNQIWATDNEASFFELDRAAYYSLIENLMKVSGEPIPKEIRDIFQDFNTDEGKRKFIYKELSKITNDEHADAAFSRINQMSNLVLNNEILTEENIEKLRVR
jgi:hypothetical protein